MMDLSKLDEQTIKRMKSWCGSLERCTKKIEVLDEWSDIECSLHEFEKKYQGAIRQIPHDVMDKAYVEIDLGGYDRAGHFSIFYYSQETDEEWSKRMEEALEYAREKQQQEVALYEKLKNKYGQ